MRNDWARGCRRVALAVIGSAGLGAIAAPAADSQDLNEAGPSTQGELIEVILPQSAAAQPDLTFDPAFCDDLVRLERARGRSFEGLRGRPIDNVSWVGDLIVEDANRCEIEGRPGPMSAYICRGFVPAAAQSTDLLPAFGELIDAVEGCLDRELWQKRLWQRGELFEFADGERRLQFRGSSQWPQPVVVVRLRQDCTARLFDLELVVGTHQ
ncbi:MAG: hypothetical protein ACFB6S_03045 [Geminicoccaceae bacterium]